MAKICAYEGCTMPAWDGHIFCDRHVLFGERCIVPGCKRERLWPDLTCCLYLLDDARLPEDEDTQPSGVVARGGSLS